jgi:anaerobic selenocysteine-containing dehydrogenase
MKLIVVDPRRTELAAQADVHLQLAPGTDAVLFAGLLHVILAEGLQDEAFCADHVGGLEELRAGVASITPAVAAAASGLDPDQLIEAARIFGRAQRGMAKSGTGPNMGPTANLAEHLLQALNVVCGRFPRAGDHVASAGVLAAPRSGRAQVLAPSRGWERGYRSRFGHGLLLGELPSASLPEEILAPGPDRIRALVVVGGNPANAFPGQARVLEALQELELLVTIDPYMTETARLAHYVIAPTLAFERPDDTRGYEHYFSAPFAQYTPALLERPAGVIEDWEFFFHLASEMGLTLQIGRRSYEPGGAKPTSDALLRLYASHGRVPHDEVRRHPHGRVFENLEPERVRPAAENADGRFDLFPPDVADELAAALAATGDERPDRPYRLIVRRARETMNSLGRRLPGLPRRSHNPCFMHPDDLAALGAEPGCVVTLTSDHGRIDAIAEADRTVRRGVVSMTHGYGDLPGEDADPRRYGSNPARLLSITSDLQSINLMPLMSAVPVEVTLTAPASAGARTSRSQPGRTDRG